MFDNIEITYRSILNEVDFKPMKKVEVTIPTSEMIDIQLKYSKEEIIQELGQLVYDRLITYVN